MSFYKIVNKLLLIAILLINVAYSMDVPQKLSKSVEVNNSISWKIPADIDTPKVITTATLQRAFDVFSWENFIALSWPANSNGEPDKTKMIGDDAKSVWEYWMHTSDIFLPDGSKPNPFGTPVNTQSYCKNHTTSFDLKLLTQNTKVSDFLILSEEPMNTGPLIDQNGEYAQYEINLNENMYDYIVNNELYNLDGQQIFANEKKVINFDSGNNTSGEVGAIMVKAAWKILGKDDDPSRFHTSTALVWNNPNEVTTSEGGTCRLVKVGLVGFHIGHKTLSAPQWVWSTFEQIDNAPEEGGECEGKYNFHNCECKNCPVNKLSKQPWNQTVKGQTPTQVVRVVPITEATKELNREYQNLLKEINPNSPWQYYMLISTQWPTNPGDPVSYQNPDPKGAPAPMVLSNTTLETFTQGTVPQIGTSCIDCHFAATNRVGKWTDFTYTLGMASKKSKGEKKDAN